MKNNKIEPLYVVAMYHATPQGDCVKDILCRGDRTAMPFDVNDYVLPHDCMGAEPDHCLMRDDISDMLTAAEADQLLVALAQQGEVAVKLAYVNGPMKEEGYGLLASCGVVSGMDGMGGVRVGGQDYCWIRVWAADDDDEWKEAPKRTSDVYRWAVHAAAPRDDIAASPVVYMSAAEDSSHDDEFNFDDVGSDAAVAHE